MSHSNTAPAAKNMNADVRLREMEKSLLERDHLVEMLTEQLEHAADQLDRMQRSGSDRRTASGPSATLPQDLVDGQQSLLSQLNRVLTEWEETHAAEILSRIESQVFEIRDMVSSGRIASPHSTIHESPKSSQAAEAPTSASQPVNPVAAPKSTSNWEAIKAAMLSGEPLPESPAPASSAPQVTAEIRTDSAVSSERPANSTSTDVSPLPDPPTFIDLESANLDELRSAVEERDRYITRLLRRVTAHDFAKGYPDWERLNDVPDALRQELDSLRTQMREKLRLAEVDLSLQRARLGREESRVQHQTNELNKRLKHLKKHGVSIPDLDGSTDDSDVETQPSNSRRWLPFLNRGQPVSAKKA